MKQTPVKARRKFDETFKLEAVQNWLNSGKSAELIALASFERALTIRVSAL